MSCSGELKIEKVDGRWLLSCGPNFSDPLTSDEALWVVANFLMGKQHHWMKSYEEHITTSFDLKRPIAGLLVTTQQMDSKRE